MTHDDPAPDDRAVMQECRRAGWELQERLLNEPCRHRWCQFAYDDLVVCMVCGIDHVQP